MFANFGHCHFFMNLCCIYYVTFLSLKEAVLIKDCSEYIN